MSNCQLWVKLFLHLTYQHCFTGIGAEDFIRQIVIYLDIPYKIKYYRYMTVTVTNVKSLAI
jgi:hypothetical protein